jgi:hypothetical protein
MSFAEPQRLSWPDWHAKMMDDLREERAKARATAERSTRCANLCVAEAAPDASIAAPPPATSSE